MSSRIFLLFLAVLALARISWSAAPTAPSPRALYSNDRYAISFEYPRDWTVQTDEGWRNPDARDEWQARVIANAPASSTAPSFALLIWAPKSAGLKQWIEEHFPDSSSVDFDVARRSIGGREAFWWDSTENLGVFRHVFFQTADYIFSTTVPLDPSASTTTEIARTLLLHSPAGGSALEQALLDSGIDGAEIPEAQSCTSCNETDAYTNSYSCAGCEPFGNCTWKCEQQRSGANSFYFSGSGRDAYKWMDLEFTTSPTNAQGGTIPVVGAVATFIATYCSCSKSGCSLGHVGTVQSVRSDGGVTLVEQGCGAFCTRTTTISASCLRSYLAGYIYNGASAPTPTAKLISDAIGASTIVEDHNLSNVYNFIASGPGTRESFNGNFRAWYTSGDPGTSGAWMHATRTKSGTSENHGRWRVNIQTTGVYEVQAFIPNSSKAEATAAQYLLAGTYSTAVNQATKRGSWVTVVNPARSDGYWSLTSGVRDVYLYDTRGGASGKWLAFDALKFIRRR